MLWSKTQTRLTATGPLTAAHHKDTNIEHFFIGGGNSFRITAVESHPEGTRTYQEQFRGLGNLTLPKKKP